MKNVWQIGAFILLSAGLTGCGALATTTPTQLPTATVTPQPTVTPTPTSTATPLPPLSFTSSEFPELTVLISPEIASGGQSQVIPFGNTDTAQGENLPRHLLVNLQGYPGPTIQFQGPAIRVFTVAGLESGYHYQVQNARLVLTGAAPEAGIYPALPIISGATQLQIRFKPLAFQNGQGFRFLEYEGTPTLEALENQSLNYVYQGISADNQYYLSVIFPVKMPFLNEAISQAATQAARSTTPLPQEYFLLPILQKLQAANETEFTPPLSALDEIIASLSLEQP